MLVDGFGGKAKVVIGMAHVGALPGSPLCDARGGLGKLVDDVARDVEQLQAGGVDTVMFDPCGGQTRNAVGPTRVRRFMDRASGLR